MSVYRHKKNGHLYRLYTLYPACSKCTGYIMQTEPLYSSSPILKYVGVPKKDFHYGGLGCFELAWTE